jgi:hypothetical protein
VNRPNAATLATLAFVIAVGWSLLVTDDRAHAHGWPVQLDGTARAVTLVASTALYAVRAR